MDITWYGMSCFRITERGKMTLITDPYTPSIGIQPGGTTKTDITTISHDAPGHNHTAMLKGDFYTLSTPGEYEIGGTFITGLALHNTEREQYNIGYLFDYDGLTVFHVGDLSHVPQQSVIEGLGQVNVLLVPVGGGGALNAAQASDLVGLVEPNIIIPMHYHIPQLNIELDESERFLKAMGVSQAEVTSMYRVTSASLPEQPQVVILEPNLATG